MVAKHPGRLGARLNPQHTSGFAIIIPMNMRIVTVSTKEQITIPKALRERLGIQPGDKVELWVDKGRLRARSPEPVPKHSRRL
jgi:AbrB family looped-hinge helix DNA binding protein